MKRKNLMALAITVTAVTILVLPAAVWAKKQPCGCQTVIVVYRAGFGSPVRTAKLLKALKVKPLYDYGRFGFDVRLSAAQRKNLAKMPDVKLIKAGGQFVVGLKQGVADTQFEQTFGVKPTHNYKLFNGFSAKLTARQFNRIAASQQIATLTTGATDYSIGLDTTNIHSQADVDAAAGQLASKYGFRLTSYPFYSAGNPGAGYGPKAEIAGLLNPDQLAGLDSDSSVATIGLEATASIPEYKLPLPKPAPGCKR